MDARASLKGDAVKIPDLTTVVGGVTGRAIEVLQAGAQGVAAGTPLLTGVPSRLRATATGAMQALAGPVARSVMQSTGRVLGTGNSADGATATVRWQSGKRVHLDLDPLLPFPRWHEHAATVEEPVCKIPGVAA